MNENTSTTSTTFTGQPFASGDVDCYDVIASTAKTITVRRRRLNGVSYPAPAYDQGPFPVMANETESDPDGRVKVLRLRKSGFYKRSSSGVVLRFSDVPLPVIIDYRR
jgi:hypothetical protein